jgi:predicted RNA-binding Zn-ribbon protein involved in translation (DUF1610 family)
MACPTCSHTMEGLDAREGERLFWCPRCGTIKQERMLGGCRDNIGQPKLVAYIKGVEEQAEHAICKGREGFWVPSWEFRSAAESVGVKVI